MRLVHLSGLVLSTLCGAAAAATFTPTRFDDPVPGPCLAADCSLREAVMAANLTAATDTIRLAAGTYVLTHVAAGDTSAYDLDVNFPLIVTGPTAGARIDNAMGIVTPQTRLFDVHGTSLTMRYVSLRAGAVADARGGCVRVDDGSLSFGTASMARCAAPTGSAIAVADGGASLAGATIYRNDGTAIAITNGTLHLSSSTVSQNVGDRGGGVYFDGDAATGALTASGASAIVENEASMGGGIMIEWGTSASISGPAGGWLAIADNIATSGGGVLAGFGDATLRHLAVTGNSADGWGGGLFLHGVDAQRLRVEGNIAGGSGGGLYTQCGPIAYGCVVSESTFIGNTAADDGGAIVYSAGGRLDVTNVSMHGNAATIGGGIAARGAVRATHVTSYQDSATVGPSFAHVYNPGTLTASTIRNSALLYGCGVVGAATILSEGGNVQLTSTPSCGFNAAGDLPAKTNSQADIVVGNYGGGMTVVAMLATSHLVDAGRAAWCQPRDVRGYTRPATCDIGAFEVGATAP